MSLKKSLVAGLIIGLVFGSIIGYSFSNITVRDQQQSTQIANLQQRVSELQQALAKKETQVSNLQQTISNLQKQLADKDVQISNLMNETTYLQKEINRIIKATRIVQSEAYLIRMNGTFNEKIGISRESTYFTTLGRQIKIIARLWANQKVIVEFGYCSVSVSYLYRGTYVGVTSTHFKFSEGGKWDFTYELDDVLYLKLDKIPEEIFGKVPLCIRLYLGMRYPRFYENPSLLIFYEVTAYDVYPP